VIEQCAQGTDHHHDDKKQREHTADKADQPARWWRPHWLVIPIWAHWRTRGLEQLRGATRAHTSFVKDWLLPRRAGISHGSVQVHRRGRSRPACVGILPRPYRQMWQKRETNSGIYRHCRAKWPIRLR
jgi:hypothetical protein